jgi:hypothetical protein
MHPGPDSQRQGGRATEDPPKAITRNPSRSVAPGASAYSTTLGTTIMLSRFSGALRKASSTERPGLATSSAHTL